LHLLGAQPFLLVNADVFCECDFARLLGHPLGERLAHLVLVANPAHRARGDFSLVTNEIKSNDGPRYTYAGIAVVSPRLVESVSPGEKAPLAPLLYAAADRGLMTGELYRGLWQDVGTRERLAELESLLGSRHENR
jgi:MurNAc alpha-1-phosphate uridylyltransferase